jgi:Cytochrome C oxidase, cbb3-type, subunit III
VLPRLDWSADQPPGAIEQTLARNILVRWVRRSADSGRNPLLPTEENLSSARTEYEEHCAACHGFDGSGRNRFEAEFYPSVAKLTDGAQKFSDAQLYFIVANGIRNTAMPAFGKNHSTKDIWRSVLWTRHLANLSPAEKTAIESQMNGTTEEHEKTMEHDDSERRRAE